ncbi:hypothetical protein Rsub_04040 [Raphidocelis subcapitata]|uniref:MYND-type domain-containing protein n=1 Tax=Raphidocelis subcapitata TaxID=307507 RepID=A0A2V0NVT3_9CHLO|nr:hypothetical protein Rsub_04040 [Raphidocelis subcapitata]|eukprot:GBF91736.1 hypothetical protein Rsub_04040 [Raphidocelis subcapitata]
MSGQAANPQAEEEEDIVSEDDGFMYTNRRGLCYCSQHRRDICHVCCVDHRMTNDIYSGMEVEEADAKAESTQRAEHEALARAHAARGGRGPLVLGSEGVQELYDAVAAPPPSGHLHSCAACGNSGTGLRRCSACGTVWYCNRDCQRSDWSLHKPACVAARAAAAGGAGAAAGGAAGGSAGAAAGGSAGAAAGGSSGSAGAAAGGGAGERNVVGWRALADRGPGVPAVGKTLEVRILSVNPPFMRWTCSAKDKRGRVATIAWYLEGGNSPPAGLRPGAVLRWRNPRYHMFIDGQVGARIEDEDLADIQIT